MRLDQEALATCPRGGSASVSVSVGSALATHLRPGVSQAANEWKIVANWVVTVGLAPSWVPPCVTSFPSLRTLGVGNVPTRTSMGGKCPGHGQEVADTGSDRVPGLSSEPSPLSPSARPRPRATCMVQGTAPASQVSPVCR